MADKMLKIELKKSLIGRGAKQIATAEALGLKKPGDRKSTRLNSSHP